MKKRESRDKTEKKARFKWFKS